MSHQHSAPTSFCCFVSPFLKLYGCVNSINEKNEKNKNKYSTRSIKKVMKISLKAYPDIFT